MDMDFFGFPALVLGLRVEERSLRYGLIGVKTPLFFGKATPALEKQL